MGPVGRNKWETALWRAIIAALALIAALATVAWKLDEHYVTRTEFNLMLVELHAIHDDVRSLRPPVER